MSYLTLFSNMYSLSNVNLFFIMMSCLQWRSATAHIHNVVSVRSLPEMCAARHDMVEITCGCTAHTVLALPAAPRMFHCHGWQSAMYATAMCDHSGVVLLVVKSYYCILSLYTAKSTMQTKFGLHSETRPVLKYIKHFY